MTTSPIGSSGSYVDANGVKTWHESWGSGPPLVLLHGGLASSALWEPQVPAFAEHFTVHVYDRRAHGRTGDVGELSYKSMTQDAIAFLEAVEGVPAHLVGWSDGGNIALAVAARRPDLVAKLVPISASIDPSGAPEAMTEGLKATPPDSPEFEMLRALYATLSPDGPDHWPEFFQKSVRMITSETVLVASELAGITAPTMLMLGDDDLVTLEHTSLILRGLSDAQLAIVPGTSHVLALEKPNLVNQLILDFLLKDPVTTMMPIRRVPKGHHA